MSCRGKSPLASPTSAAKVLCRRAQICRPLAGPRGRAKSEFRGFNRPPPTTRARGEASGASEFFAAKLRAAEVIPVGRTPSGGTVSSVRCVSYGSPDHELVLAGPAVVACQAARHWLHLRRDSQCLRLGRAHPRRQANRQQSRKQTRKT